MTPELINACELVFQQHKTSGQPIHWTKDTFQGRLSFGLSALAKQTLETRNIICSPNPSKKTITILNPAAAGATSFEEAEDMIKNKTNVLVKQVPYEQPVYIALRIKGDANTATPKHPIKIESKTIRNPIKLNGSVKPMLYYFALLLGGVIAGGLITYLLGLLV